MSTTQHTGHYNLPTFGDNPNDRPSWRGDFTDAMTKIDNQMYANATNITTATAAANNATTAAGEAKTAAESAAELAQTNKNDIADLDSYFGKLGVTSETTAQQLMNTINGKAEDTDLTSLESTVSSLSSTVNTKANTSDVYTKGQADTTFTKQGGYSGTAQQLNQQIAGIKATADKNTDDIEAILMRQTPRYRKIVAVGDSITYGTGTTSAATKNWVAQLAPLVGNPTVVNLAENGAGFVSFDTGAGGKTFIQQLQSAATTHSDADCIIIAGGINDSASTGVYTAVRNCLNYACSTWSNADVWYIPDMIAGCIGYNGYKRKNLEKMGDLLAAPRGLRCKMIKYAWEWLNVEDVSMDGIHADDTGSQMFAQYVFSAMCGNVPRANKNAELITGGPGISFSANNMVCEIIDGMCQIHGNVVLSTQATAFTRLFNLPKGFDYSSYLSGMVSDADGVKNIFYPDASYEPNTVMTYSTIPSGKSIYANCSFPIGVSVAQA